MAKHGGNSKRKRRTKNYSDRTKSINKDRRTTRHLKWTTNSVIAKRRRLIARLKANNALIGDEANVTIQTLRKRLYPFTKHYPVIKWSELLREQIARIKEGLG